MCLEHENEEVVEKLERLEHEVFCEIHRCNASCEPPTLEFLKDIRESLLKVLMEV